LIANTSQWLLPISIVLCKFIPLPCLLALHWFGAFTVYHLYAWLVDKELRGEEKKGKTRLCYLDEILEKLNYVIIGIRNPKTRQRYCTIQNQPLLNWRQVFTLFSSHTLQKRKFPPGHGS